MGTSRRGRVLKRESITQTREERFSPNSGWQAVSPQKGLGADSSLLARLPGRSEKK